MSNFTLIMINIIGWGVGCFFYKIANANIHPIIVSTLVTLLYAIATPIAWMFMKFDHKLNVVGVSTALIGGGFICAASIAYFYSLQKGDAGQVTALTSLYPALTMLLSVMFLGESLSFKKVIGILLACASFYFLFKR